MPQAAHARLQPHGGCRSSIWSAPVLHGCPAETVPAAPVARVAGGTEGDATSGAKARSKRTSAGRRVPLGRAGLGTLMALVNKHKDGLGRAAVGTELGVEKAEPPSAPR